MPISHETGSLFPSKRGAARRPTHLAEVRVDGHSLGQITEVEQITAAMRSHGITERDIEPILRGRRHTRNFRCNGEVRIVGVAVAKKAAA